MTHGGNDSARELPAWYIAVGKERSPLPMFEYIARQGFPTVRQLRHGILLGCIADALYSVAHNVSYAGRSWDGDTYQDDNEQGELWAAAFTPAGAVAVFYSSESERNPFPRGSPPYDQSLYFRGMPASLETAKERALSWMMNLDWTAGGPKVITSAMWADAEQFEATEPWEVVFRNSLWACHKQLLPLTVAIIEWRNEFDLNDEEAAVLRSLYERRVASNEATVSVTARDREVLTRNRDSAGTLAARDALAHVGIALTID
jgi:hypothetical protein